MAQRMALMTEQNVREALPDVQVTFMQAGKPVTITCIVRGRKNEFATVQPFEYGSATSWQFSWAAIRDSVNSGNPLKV